MAQSENFSLQEAFKVLLECRNQGELSKAIKDHIYPVFEDDFRHFVIQVSKTDPPPPNRVRHIKYSRSGNHSILS